MLLGGERATVEQSERKRPNSLAACAAAGLSISLPLRQPRMRDLAGSTVKSSARIVFAALCDYGNPNRHMWPPWAPDTTPDGYLAWPSVARISQVTALSERAVQEALRELELKQAVICVSKSQGGAPRKGRLGQRPQPAHTNCYLITPHLAHRCFDQEADQEPKEPRASLLTTPQLAPNNPAPPAPLNPAPAAPNRSNHHHQKDRTKKKTPNIETVGRSQAKSVASVEIKTGRRKPFSNSFSDDDEKPKRESLEEPTEELRLRFKERFGDASGAILQTIVDELNDRQALAEFVAFDDAHTGAPERLKNPGGYYRALVKQFRAARLARVESEQRERYRVLERSLNPQEQEERPVCELGVCDGGGELREDGKYRPCDCAAGQKLSPKVREMMEALNRGAA